MTGLFVCGLRAPPGSQNRSTKAFESGFLDTLLGCFSAADMAFETDSTNPTRSAAEGQGVAQKCGIYHTFVLHPASAHSAHFTSPQTSPAVFYIVPHFSLAGGLQTQRF